MKTHVSEWENVRMICPPHYRAEVAKEGAELVARLVFIPSGRAVAHFTAGSEAEALASLTRETERLDLLPFKRVRWPS